MTQYVVAARFLAALLSMHHSLQFLLFLLVRVSCGACTYVLLPVALSWCLLHLIELSKVVRAHASKGCTAWA